jgi:hypothetical protein
MYAACPLLCPLSITRLRANGSGQWLTTMVDVTISRHFSDGIGSIALPPTDVGNRSNYQANWFPSAITTL